MLKIKNVCGIVALSLISSYAFSGSDSGLYVGGSLGMTSSTVTYSNYDGEFDDDDTGYKIFAGYNLGLVPFIDLAIEGSYVDFGKSGGELLSQEFGTEKFSTERTAWDLFGLAGFTTGPVAFFGKVGVVSWDTEVSIQDVEDTLKDDGSDLAYGVGAKFQLMSFSVRAEYEYFDFEHIDTDMISVGAAFTF
ncbi:porin family protein [Teredinibacter haidensis]|uniref:porin family protein n=1 Tax=Teredinibacter haidensis TaxID=2731755 RepID=UPI0009488F4F|nr:porin family protein [Teredinibacter haidensis]